MGTTAGDERERVLVMDDDPFIREVASEMLVFIGYDVALAAEGAEAVAMYKQAMDSGHAFAAVIMDLTIDDGMGGVETLQHLKTIDPEVRALVSSGNASDPAMADYVHCGFSGTVAKPYRVDELEQQLKSIIPGEVGSDGSSRSAQD